MDVAITPSPWGRTVRMAVAHPFFLFFFNGWGDGHIHSHYSSLRDGEMATSSLTVLPQGDGVMATSILLFLL